MLFAQALYASLSPDLEDEPDLEVEFMAPAPGDPADYAVVRARDGRRWALTVTCAANALGRVPDGAYALGSREAALHGFRALGRRLGCSDEEAARRMLDLAAHRVARAVDRLRRDARLRRRRFDLVAGGGGAGALVPAVADRLGLPYHCVPHAEVISSLGDALAAVREERERTINNAASAEELARQAEHAAISAGADPGTVQVVMERDEERGTLRAIAVGHVALRSAAPGRSVDQASAQALAARAVELRIEDLALVADTGGFWVFQSRPKVFRRLRIVVVDQQGAVRLKLGGARVIAGTAESVLGALRQALTTSPTLLEAAPSVRLLVGARLLDLATGVQVDGALPVVKAALAATDATRTVAAILQD